MLAEYLSELLQPWRRVSRAEFGAALGVASVPGLVLMVTGFIEGGSGLLGPLATLAQGGGGATSAQAATLENALTQLSTSAPVAAFEPTSLINPLVLLALTPFCRGRLNDMGYTPTPALALTAAIQLSTLNDLVSVFYTPGVLPMAWLFMLANFGGYIWLTLGKPAPRLARHEQVPNHLPPHEEPHRS